MLLPSAQLTKEPMGRRIGAEGLPGNARGTEDTVDAIQPKESDMRERERERERNKEEGGG